MSNHSKQKIEGIFKSNFDKYKMEDSIWVTLSLRNTGNENLYIFVPHGRVEGLYFQIKENEGYFIKPLTKDPDAGFVPEIKLVPRETYSQRYLISEWIKFDKVGKYSVQCSIPIEYSEHSIRDNNPNRKTQSVILSYVVRLAIE